MWLKHSKNFQFLTFANNGGDADLEDFAGNPNFNRKLQREWQAQNFNNVGTVNVNFTNEFEGLFLVTDVDGDFTTTGDQTIVGQLDGNGSYQNVTFNDGIFFTLVEEPVVIPNIPPVIIAGGVDTIRYDTLNNEIIISINRLNVR